MLAVLIVLSVVLLLSFIMGLVICHTEHEYDSFLEVKNNAFNMPIKKILFPLGLGLISGYWLFGFNKKNKSINEEIRQKDKRLDFLEKEYERLLKENANMAAELHLLSDDNRDLIDIINE